MLIQIFYYLNSCVIEDPLEKIYEKCIHCKDANNGIKHVVNECKCLKEERKVLITKIQYINNTWGTNLLREI